MEICEFVSFSLAKKLKEKGFNQPCLAHYTNGKFEYNIAYFDAVTLQDLYENWSHGAGCFVDAPTISQVLKWLREEKKIFVEIVITPMGLYKSMIYDIGGFKKPYRDISPRIDFNEAAIAGIEYCLDNLI